MSAAAVSVCEAPANSELDDALESMSLTVRSEPPLLARAPTHRDTNSARAVSCGRLRANAPDVSYRHAAASPGRRRSLGLGSSSARPRRRRDTRGFADEGRARRLRGSRARAPRVSASPARADRARSFLSLRPRAAPVVSVHDVRRRLGARGDDDDDPTAPGRQGGGRGVGEEPGAVRARARGRAAHDAGAGRSVLRGREV